MVRVLLAVFAFGALVGPRAEAAPRRDDRSALNLGYRDSEELKRGMRAYLESVQGILEGLVHHDMKKVASSADAAGMGMLKHVPWTSALSLPPEFVLMSMDTHQKFDELSAAARAHEPKQALMAKLSEVLGNCTACHALFRLAPLRRK